jgi:hypothetical protein
VTRVRVETDAALAGLGGPVVSVEIEWDGAGREDLTARCLAGIVAALADRHHDGEEETVSLVPFAEELPRVRPGDDPTM